MIKIVLITVYYSVAWIYDHLFHIFKKLFYFPEYAFKAINQGGLTSVAVSLLKCRTSVHSPASWFAIWKWKYLLLSHVLLFATPWTKPVRLLCLWDFPGKNTGVGSPIYILPKSRGNLYTLESLGSTCN